MTEVLDQAAKKGVEATLISSETERSSVSFEFNRLKKIESTESLSMSLQVIKRGKLGIVSSTRAGSEESMLEKAMDVAEYGPPVSYEFPSPEPHADPKLFHQDVADLKMDEMISLGEELVKHVKSLDPSIQGSAGVSRTVSRKSIKNTRGLDASWKKTSFSISAGFQFVEGRNLLESWDWDVSTSVKYNLERIKAKIQEDFELGRKNASVEPGLYNVLFTPMGLASIIHPILACIDGRAVMRGISPLKDRLGEEILSPAFSLVEDGTLEEGLGSQLYDDQGVACRRTPLIDKGVLKEYLLDLESAKRLGRNPIGTGSASGANPNNLLIVPGDTPWEELLNGMKRGIVIDQTMGAWAGNPYTGTVTGNISLGFLVVDGKKVGRVKDCMFSLNIFTHLKSNLLALSKETKNAGDAILPYCLLGGVSIAARVS